MTPSEKGVYEVRGRTCQCEGLDHGTQTFKLFSTVNDMPHGMWLSHGKFHEKNAAQNVAPGTVNSDGKKEGQRNFLMNSERVDAERHFGSATKNTAVGTDVVEGNDSKNVIKNTASTKRNGPEEL